MSSPQSFGSTNTALLREKNGRFFLFQPDLGVVASGDNIGAAYEQFGIRKREVIQEIENAGLQDQLMGPASYKLRTPATYGRRNEFAEIGIFFIKMCIVLLALGSIGGLAAISAKRSVETLEARLNAYSMSIGPKLKQFIAADSATLRTISVVDVVGKIAKHADAMPPDRKEQLRKDIAIISRELGPLVATWQNPSAAPSEPPK